MDTHNLTMLSLAAWANCNMIEMREQVEYRTYHQYYTQRKAPA